MHCPSALQSKSLRQSGVVKLQSLLFRISSVSLCNRRFTGDEVVCFDINECNISKTNCHDNADCTNTPGSFECTCHTGYTCDGVTSCTDIDECAEDKGNFHVNANCSNTLGSFKCTCHTGFTGDGVSCTDIDECAENKDNCLADRDCT